MTSFALRIAELTVRVSGEEEYTVPDPLARFLIDPGAAADLDLLVRRGAIPLPSGSPTFDSGGVWSLYENDGTSTIVCRSPAFPDDPYKATRVDHHFSCGEITMSGNIPPAANPLDYPLDELLFANLLGRGAGVELHACGLVAGRKGYLFVGQSGAGKTTTARLWRQTSAVMLSDDRIIVRKHANRFRIHGTPWHGEAEICAAADAPLSGVYLLKQAARNEARPLAPAEAVSLLFTCAFPLLHRQDSVVFALSFLSDLVEQVPVSELRFTPTVDMIDTVRACAPQAVNRR